MQTAYTSFLTRASMTCPYQPKINSRKLFIAEYWEIVYFRQSRTKLLRHITKFSKKWDIHSPPHPLSLLIACFCVLNVRYESTLIKNNQHWSGGVGGGGETSVNLCHYIFSQILLLMWLSQRVLSAIVWNRKFL